MSARLTAFALGLATTSLLVAAYAVLSRPSASDGTACDCDTEGLQAQLAALQRRVDAAERTALRGTARRVAEAATEPRRTSPGDSPAFESNDDGEPPEPDQDGTNEDDAEPRTTPRFVDFEIADPGVTVTQAENGSLSVSNSNEALAGQIMTVKARGEDGEVYDLPITVPPVE